MKQHEAIKAVDQVVTKDYAIYQGDSCEVIRAIPERGEAAVRALVALLGVALGTVLLPRLSAAHAKQDHTAYSALLDWGLRLVLLLGLPAAARRAGRSPPSVPWASVVSPW